MRRLALLIPAALLLAAPVAGASPGPSTFAEAQALSAETGKPILVDFFTTWCGPCKAFDKAVKTDADIQAALERVVLFKTDAEKEGLDLAKEYGVKFYPTYVLMTSEGASLERWSGYDKGMFLETYGIALADPTTIEQKRARFAEAPTAKDAARLATYHETVGEHREAVELFARAQELDGEDRTFEIFVSTAYGADADQFTMDDARGAADAMLASADVDTDDVLGVYSLMSMLESRKHQPGLATPYLKAAYEVTEGNEELASTRSRLAVDYAVRIEKDKDKAFELKLASMPDGWKDDAAGLNAMAWWCFENDVKLDEAEELARRGVDVATDAGVKGNILDTLAEICNARGNCPEAVVYMRQAVELNPGREYFRKQLDRFEKLAAVSTQ